jgi:cation:H+ antiporter
LRALPLRWLLWYALTAALVILACGVLPVDSAATLAVRSALGGSFIGVTLRAASTSLTQVSTTVAAVRLRA